MAEVTPEFARHLFQSFPLFGSETVQGTPVGAESKYGTVSACRWCSAKIVPCHVYPGCRPPLCAACGQSEAGAIEVTWHEVVPPVALLDSPA